MENNKDLSVPFVRLVPTGDNVCAFEDDVVDVRFGDPDDPPLAKSAIIPAASICFCSMPADQAANLHAVPGRQMIIVLTGELDVTASPNDSRTFGLGDFFELGHATGKSHSGLMQTKAPASFALIDLVPDAIAGCALPKDDQATGRGANYVRTTDGPDGLSRTNVGELPYRQEMAYGQSTEKFSVSGIQFVFAPGDLNYAWHRAPQRQFVIPLTGGMEVENGLGHHHTIRPGEIYIGEDVNGNGHITRAIADQQRLSVFAHLAHDVSD